MMGLTQPTALPPSSSPPARTMAATNAASSSIAADGVMKGLDEGDDDRNSHLWANFPLVLVRQVQTLTQDNYSLRGQVEALRAAQSDMAAMVKRLMQKVTDVEMAQARQPCSPALGERNANKNSTLYAPHEAALTVLSEQVGLLRRRLDKHSERLKRGDLAGFAALRQGQEQANKKVEALLAQHTADTAAAMRALEMRCQSQTTAAAESMQQTMSSLRTAVDELRTRQETSENRCTALQEADAGHDVIIAELQKAIQGTKDGLRRTQTALEQLGASFNERLTRSEAACRACDERHEAALRTATAAQTRAWAQSREVTETTCAELRQTLTQAEQSRRRSEAQLRRALQALDAQCATRATQSDEVVQALKAECRELREVCQTRCESVEAVQEAMRGELSDVSRTVTSLQRALGSADDTTRLTRGLQEVAQRCQEIGLQRERDLSAVAALQSVTQRLDTQVQELQATREADAEELRREQRLLGVALREEMQQQWRDVTGRQSSQVSDCLATTAMQLREAEARLQASLQAEVTAQRRSVEELQRELTSHLQALAERQAAREEAQQAAERTEGATRQAALMQSCVEAAVETAKKTLVPRLEQVEAVQHNLQSEAAQCLSMAARPAQELPELQRRLSALEERHRQAASEFGVVSELQTQWQAALREHKATNEAIHELRQRSQELMRKALQNEQHCTSLGIEVHQSDGQVRHVEQTLVRLSADMTGMLERLLRTEESLGPRRGGLQVRLTQVERDVEALQRTSCARAALHVDGKASDKVVAEDFVRGARMDALEATLEQLAQRLEQTQTQQRQTERAFAELAQSLTTAVTDVVHGDATTQRALHETPETTADHHNEEEVNVAPVNVTHSLHDEAEKSAMTLLTQQLRAVQVAVECLSETHQSLRCSLMQQQEQLRELHTQLDTTNNTTNADIAELRRDRAAIATRLAAAEGKLDKTTERQETALQVCTKAHEQQQEQLAAMEQSVSELAQRMQGCEESLSALASVRATCEAALHSAKQLMQETQCAAAEVNARCYPKSELEERLENLWLSVTELLARKADRREVEDTQQEETLLGVTREGGVE